MLYLWLWESNLCACGCGLIPKRHTFFRDTLHILPSTAPAAWSSSSLRMVEGVAAKEGLVIHQALAACPSQHQYGLWVVTPATSSPSARQLPPEQSGVLGMDDEQLLEAAVVVLDDAGSLRLQQDPETQALAESECLLRMLATMLLKKLRALNNRWNCTLYNGPIWLLYSPMLAI